MTSDVQISDLLEALAAKEFSEATAWAARMESPLQTVVLMEACRTIDIHHVMQFISANTEHKIPDFDFDLMMRGWNSLLSIILPHVKDMGGVPSAESTPQTRGLAFAALTNLGRASLCRETARRIRYGMMTGSVADSTVRVRMTDRCGIDHFLDRLDHDGLAELEKKLSKGKPRYHAVIEKAEVPDLDARLAKLVFPWKPDPQRDVTMVGYDAEPDIDNYYFALAMQGADDGSDEAGIHDDSRLGSVEGRDLSMIVFLTISFYLKHLRLVDHGKRKFPDVNYAMSLTIWKSREEYVASLADFLNMPLAKVSAAVDLMTVRPKDFDFFASDPTTYIPMLIEVSSSHLLAPISSVFRNPFHGIRMLHEFRNPKDQSSISRPREKWMMSDLYHLFAGNRYRLMDNPTRLSRGGEIVTDIDAAVLDVLTGEIALFQLKWQDFNSNDVRRQSSRAKNFVEKVDAWASRTEQWIAEFGLSSLLQALRISVPASTPPSSFRLFALGRSAARFRSYGFVPKNVSVAACSWRQFIKLRYKIGPADRVISELHAKIQTEHTKQVQPVPVEQELSIGGYRIVFENLYNGFEDSEEVIDLAPE